MLTHSLFVRVTERAPRYGFAPLPWHSPQTMRVSASRPVLDHLRGVASADPAFADAGSGPQRDYLFGRE